MSASRPAAIQPSVSVAANGLTKRTPPFESGAELSPFTWRTSVISGHASASAFCTPSVNVVTDAGHDSQAPVKRTSIVAGAMTRTSCTSPPWVASIGRTPSSAASTRSWRLGFTIP